jgi:putative transposase
MNLPTDPKGWHSRGYLPHFDSPETVQHIVFRVSNSIPPEWLAEIDLNAAQRRKRVDEYLDRGFGNALLAEPFNASIVEEALLFFDGQRYRLLAWCVMPNHVHVIIEQIAGFSLGAVVKSWKMASTRAINARTGASGAIWAGDYFDRYMRNEEQLERTIAYVQNNPVNAGLCAAPADWAWSSARRRGL